MIRNSVVIAIGLLAAAAALGVVLRWAGPEPVVPAGAEPAVHVDRNAGTEARISALETAVAEERDARLLLEEELQALYAQIDALSERQDQPDAAFGADARDTRAQMMALREQRAGAASDERLERLVAAGFGTDRAAWILAREQELQLAQMQAIFEARQSGERPDPLDTRFNPAAGLRPGDEIVSYGGERVYNINDLNRQMMNTEAGRQVVVDIVRDGVPTQVVMEAGPIGISIRPPIALRSR